MSARQSVLERLTALEIITVSQSEDVKEIKGDVKVLLETKWKAEGKRMGVAAVVAALVSFASIFLGRP